MLFYFQPSFSGWSPTSIYQILYSNINKKHGNIFEHREKNYNSEGHSPNAPHHCILQNGEKYLVCSYWDTVLSIKNDYFGWKNQNCIGIYSSVDAALDDSITPTSYCCYSRGIQDYAKNNKLSFDKKEKNQFLIFRGYLYGDRFSLRQNLEKTNNIIKLYESIDRNLYVNELNLNRVCLSLNGQAEICNRDMEILSVGSVLFRPYLNRTKFYNALLPDIHYIGFDLSSDPIEQIKIIEDRFYSVQKDQDFLFFIANNGYNWFLENGTIEANAEIIYDRIASKIEELINA